jgi:hypothetical protein
MFSYVKPYLTYVVKKIKLENNFILMTSYF